MTKPDELLLDGEDELARTGLAVVVDENQNGVRIDKYLSESFPEYSRSFFQKQIKDQAVLADGRPVKANFKVAPGQKICVHLPSLKCLILCRKILNWIFFMRMRMSFWSISRKIWSFIQVPVMKAIPLSMRSCITAVISFRQSTVFCAPGSSIVLIKIRPAFL